MTAPIEIVETRSFSQWLARLRNRSAKQRIQIRILQIKAHGMLTGDWKALGGGLFELRFDFGPGYRVYVSMEFGTLLILLGGGDKSTQNADIRQARKALKDWRNGDGNGI